MKFPKLPNVKGLATIGKSFVLANRPEILFGTSIVTTLAAVGLAAQAGYKSGQQVLQVELDMTDEVLEEMRVKKTDLKEKVNLTWLNYLPAAGATAGALTSTTCLHLVHIKEKKAIAAAALMAIEEIRNEADAYKEELISTVKGELTDKQGEKVDAALEKSGLVNSDGEVEDLFLVRCPITGRDIWSNKARIEEAMVEVGNCMNASSHASLNTFWEQAGWGRLNEIGEQLGWSGVIPAISWHDTFGRQIAGVRDDGRPYRSFRFLPEPEKGYDEYS